MLAARSILIPSRFNGPPNSGNGGYSAGALGTLLEGSVEVSLRSPPPLDVPLEVRREGDRLEAWHDTTLVMFAQPRALEGRPPSPPPFREARRGSLTYPSEGHPLATCFVCGPKRAAGDGLRLFTGRLEGFEGVADVWTPDASVADADGQVATEVVWAALDCPSYFGIPGQPGFALLGSICARIERRPRVGEPLVVVGWHRRSEGRKHQTGSALFSDGELIAQADTLWIQPRSEVTKHMLASRA